MPLVVERGFPSHVKVFFKLQASVPMDVVRDSQTLVEPVVELVMKHVVESFVECNKNLLSSFPNNGINRMASIGKLEQKMWSYLWATCMKLHLKATKV